MELILSVIQVILILGSIPAIIYFLYLLNKIAKKK